MRLVACETVVAITVHLRYAHGSRTTLCGSESAWDLNGDAMSFARCRDCLAAAAPPLEGPPKP